MKFPRTYVDAAADWRQKFQASLVMPGNKSITTGTTIVAMVSPDEKTGLIASDTRVTSDSWVMQDSFDKIFDCRIGFVAAAGDLGLIQQVIPVFRVSLDRICDARGRLMRASGAKTHLFNFYRQIVASGARHGVIPAIAFVALFWDTEEKRCRLYILNGTAVLSNEKFATIGSGSPFVEGQRLALGEIPSAKEEMARLAQKLIVGAHKKDFATNDRLFCGSIVNGDFETFHRNTEED